MRYQEHLNEVSLKRIQSIMKKPDKFEEFESMIRSMEHRERFCFEMGSKILEIYCTINFGTGNKNYNFKYQFNDEAKPTNRIGKNLSSETLLNVYNKLV